ncbi:MULTISPECIES: hypothetical protein [Streptomyces]|uniref:Integral membrane protein n=1 Tax=Streptomyces koelreuteriae TaxID=2838015 RepID=A0ABX8FPG5_9ACTN|nr:MULTISPECIES: hypothetical protein [Streptomyces]QWB22994.1 hypothetical protein KJK29_10535 [Streptomyces koelreuteriae]UUA05942.1 hypothetical protein NNW98_10590 [Streptomyces koelreuteriae]UUA13570.1 hypothetical protein NNW99_10590 [Streptomyces sp. CRCS-T-1]
MLIGLGISVICALGALVAAAGVVAMAFPGRPEPWLPLLLRRAAAMFAWAAVSVYSLGLFAVLDSEWEFGEGASSVPARACLDDFDRDTTAGLSHHRSSYLPLRFDCVREDGTVYSADSSYLWMNWASMSCALSAAGLGISAGYATEFRARRAPAGA